MKATAKKTTRKPASKAARKPAAVKRDKSALNPKPTVANSVTAAERIAAMGDNIRPLYTAISNVVADIHDASVKSADKSDNQSLDFVLALYAAREHVGIDILAKGNATVKPNNAQTTWLTQHVPAYGASVAASEKKIDSNLDFNRHQIASQTKENEAKAAAAIRVMFSRVVQAVYWLAHVNASNVSAMRKGKSRGLSYSYTPDGETKPIDGIVSVSAAVQKGRAVLDSAAAAAGKEKPYQAKPRKPGKSGATIATGAASTPVQSAEGLAKSVAELSTDKAKADFANAPQSEVLLCNMIAAKFEHKKTIDIGEVYKWLITQSFFKEVQFIGNAVTDTLEKKTGTGK